MSLLGLSTELIDAIAHSCDSLRDVNALARTCKRLHCILNRTLYRRDSRESDNLASTWAAKKGRVETLRRAMQAGVDVADPALQLLRAAAYDVVGDDVVRFLLCECKADPNVLCDGGFTPLHYAFNCGSEAAVRTLLDCGAGVDEPLSHGFRPLALAARYHNADIVRLLIARGAGVNLESTQGTTALTSAASEGNVEVASILISHGALINKRIDTGATPLNIAARDGHVDLAKLLIQHGAEVNVADSAGWTPLHHSANNDFSHLVRVLLDAGADTTLACGGGFTPQALAASGGHTATVKVLVAAGASVAGPNETGWTPIQLAVARRRSAELVEALIEGGADLRVATPRGWTLLALAAAYNMVDAVKVLLSHGAEARLPTWPDSGFPPLESIAIISLLIDHGADMAALNERGWSFAAEAANHDNTEVVKLALDKALVAVDHQDLDGRTMLYHGALRGKPDTVQLLIDAGADINLADRYGIVPLAAATRNGHLSTMQKLLQCPGIRLDVRDGLGRSVFWGAASCGNDQVLELARRHASDGVLVADATFIFYADECWCDACGRCSVHPAAARECPSCISSGFLLCASCIENGGTCRDSTHQLRAHTC